MSWLVSAIGPPILLMHEWHWSAMEIMEGAKKPWEAIVRGGGDPRVVVTPAQIMRNGCMRGLWPDQCRVH